MRVYQVIPLYVRKLLYLLPGILLAVLLLTILVMHAVTQQGTGAESLGEVVEASVKFPIDIAGTTLTAERTAAYDGPFLENGSNDEVTGIVALVLRNRGSRTVMQAEVVLLQGNRRLVFRAYAVPAGETVLVLEHNRSIYHQESFSSCRGFAIYEDNITDKPKGLSIYENGMDCITLHNTTDTALENVWVYHKGWLEPPGILIGGIAHRTYVGTIAPGEAVQINPDYYVHGYSRIVQIVAKKSRTE